MRFIVLATLLALGLANTAAADVTIINRRPVTIVTAQDHATFLANSGSFYHSSCNQYEGIGYGSTPEEARRRCCFFGKRVISEEGVAWSPLRRRWVAVIRYQ